MQSFEERAFIEKLPDYKAGADSLLDLTSESLASDYAAKLKITADKMCSEVLNAYSTGTMVDSNDHSVYTGISGIALLQLKLGNHQQALALIKPVLKHLRCEFRDCTFLCGDCGPLAVAALVYNRLGHQYTSQRDECIGRVIQLEKGICESPSLPNEMLYGRAGYLYTLLLLQEEFGEHIISKQSVINVSASIVKSGRELSQRLRSPCPLMYSWHDKYYTGAAHGHAGILYMLLKVVTKYPDMDIDSYLVPTLDYLFQLQFSHGNYPASFKSNERDRLVHWCHGAPGFIYMLVAAFEKYQDERYKKKALHCAEVVWNRGLLRKGYGICHGVSGNAYTFISAYKLSGEEKYLHRACQFALWCCDYGHHGCRIPDRPYSLFEGMAGTAYFLYDMLKPKQAKFPAFEI